MEHVRDALSLHPTNILKHNAKVKYLLFSLKWFALRSGDQNPKLSTDANTFCRALSSSPRGRPNFIDTERYRTKKESKRKQIKIPYLGGGGGSLSVGDGGNESTVVYPPPQQDPSNGDRSLALWGVQKEEIFQIFEMMWIQHDTVWFMFCKISKLKWTTCAASSKDFIN